MHIGDSPEESTFRAECRAWLEAHAAPRTAKPSGGMGGSAEELAEHTRQCKRWQGVLYEHGWAGIAWPTAFGGRGGTPMQAAIFAEEQNRFDIATGAFSVAAGMVAPTLMVHGTPEQKVHLDAILRGDEVWCQLFSEPGAGSDLASLGTRAERDGDEWVVNGQKVWTSLGQHSDFGILLARTDPDAPKHRGITYFIVDMTTPGIEVRPLKQMTGISHFNEVFLTDVRIPAANVVGEVNEGWRVAHTTLGNERALIGGSSGQWNFDEMIAEARARGLTDDARIRRGLVDVYIRANLLKYFGYRMRTALSRGEQPGPEASVMKLFVSRHGARSAEVAMQIIGADGTLDGDDAPNGGLWQSVLLGQYMIRIGGGTDEVQSNVIGERALGLPREPSNDREVPWRSAAKA